MTAKWKSKAFIVFLAISIMLPVAAAADESRTKPKRTVIVKEIKTKPLGQLRQIRMPVYKPPRRGTPKGRVGGGTRGGPS